MGKKFYRFVENIEFYENPVKSNICVMDCPRLQRAQVSSEEIDKSKKRFLFRLMRFKKGDIVFK